MGISKLKIVFMILLVVTSANAISGAPSFPVAAVSYLNSEMPKMEAAIETKDMKYFEIANTKMLTFLKAWELEEAGKSSLELHAYCAEAVTDHLIVGLCKILPPGSICEPSTFFPKFENNLKKCRNVASMR